MIGHFNEDLQEFRVDRRVAGGRVIAHGVYYVLPNLSRLRRQGGRSSTGMPVSGTSMMLATALGLLYIACCSWRRSLIFSRRDFK